MNSRPSACILLLWLAAGTLRAADTDDFAARFQKAKAAHDTTQTTALLDGWKRARPDDPEYYIAAANDLLDRHAEVIVSKGKTRQRKFVVTDPKTGRPAGSIARGTPSPETNRQAVALLKQGLSKAPARMDIYLGLAVLYERLDDSKALLSDLSAMAAYAKAHPGALLDREERPFPTPADEELSHEISNIASHYFKRGTAAANRTFHALAELDVEAFPDRQAGYNLLGIYHFAIANDPERALASFEHALKIAPDDSMVWTNIGELQRKTGNKKEAVAAYNKVVALGNDEDCVDQAKAELAKLK